MALSVRKFVAQSYQLISAHSPTAPLHGNDLEIGIEILNYLLESFAATGLNITIAHTESVPISIGQEFVVTGSSDYVPTPDITLGRLATYLESWLVLEGVTYPLIDIQRAEYLSAWKYEPLRGLPRYAIIFFEEEITKIRLYPSPSQPYEFFLRGKYQLSTLDSNSDMSLIPHNQRMFLLYALARDLKDFKTRSEAWNEKLEARYQELRMDIEASSEVNLAIVGDRESMLNGAWRVRAGV